MTHQQPHPNDNQSRLIRILLAQADENARIDQAREQQGSRCSRMDDGDRNMRNITEKLNRLQKTLLKKGQCKENYNQMPCTKKDKYAQLNHLNDQLRRTLAKIAGGKGGIAAEEIEKKVVSLYNSSVAVLNSQDKLNKQLAIANQKRDSIDREITEGMAEHQRGCYELSSIIALRQLSLKRLHRLSALLH